MDPLERKCPSCGELWPPMKKLTSEEHAELLATFEKKFINLFENFQHGSTKELSYLRNLVDTLKMKPEFSGPKLVIDSLNMSRGNLATDIPTMFNAVLELQKSYPGILIVSRASSISRNNPIYKGQVERLKRANVGVFHAHRQSYDDLFTILGALWLGEDTHVLSNDMYSDVCDYIRNSSAEQLFMKWLNSSMVRRNGVFEKGDFVLLPVPSFDRVVQKTSNGYHITTLKDLDDSIAGRPTTFSKIYEHYCFITDANHNTACQEISKQMSYPEKAEDRNHLWSFISINENHLKKPSIEE
uniref:PRORP domain-containing protein n=1 Tax=Acrobeloides nanus TaxID=290746 RepID=A0A914EFD2_9BILA